MPKPDYIFVTEILKNYTRRDLPTWRLLMTSRKTPSERVTSILLMIYLKLCAVIWFKIIYFLIYQQFFQQHVRSGLIRIEEMGTIYISVLSLGHQSINCEMWRIFSTDFYCFQVIDMKIWCKKVSYFFFGRKI